MYCENGVKFTVFGKVLANIAVVAAAAVASRSEVK